MHFENIIKGFFTTILGCAIMFLAVYDWWIQTEDTRDWWQVGAPFIGGFALLYMRDKVSELIAEVFRAIINRIKGNSSPNV